MDRPHAQHVTRRAVLSAGATAILASGSAGAQSDQGIGGENESTESEPLDVQEDMNEDEEAEEGEEGESPEDLPPGLRTINVSPDTPSYDLYVDGELLYEDVVHLDPHVDEMPLPDEITADTSVSVAAVAPGESPANGTLAETEIDVGDSLAEYGYTVWGIGEQCDQSDRQFQLAVIEDDHSPTPPGMSRIIAGHFSPDAPTGDVRAADGTLLFEGIEFGDMETGMIPADVKAVTVHPAGEEVEAIAEFPIYPVPGTVYSASLIGYRDLESAPSAVRGDDDWSIGLAISEDSIPGIEGEGDWGVDTQAEEEHMQSYAAEQQQTVNAPLSGQQR